LNVGAAVARGGVRPLSDRQDRTECRTREVACNSDAAWAASSATAGPLG